MNAQEESKRRTLMFTFAGIGFLYLVAFGGIVLLMSAARTDVAADVSQRPVPVQRDAMVIAPPDPAGNEVPRASLEPHWTARHKDAAGPWSIDVQGQVHWR